MTDHRPSWPRRPHRIADVQLRGPGGRLAARVYWPPAPALAPWPPPLLVLFPPGTGTGGVEDSLGLGLCALVDVVVLAVTCRPPGPDGLGPALDDATTAAAWGADHATELEATPHRILVAGEGAGADLAATVARQAADEGWPPILRHVLVRPALGPDTLGARVAGVGLAPATVATAAASATTGDRDDGRRYAAVLRRSGVAVDLVELDGTPAGSLADLASSLRRTLGLPHRDGVA
jgi:acetyl esterase/lipase